MVPIGAYITRPLHNFKIDSMIYNPNPVRVTVSVLKFIIFWFNFLDIIFTEFLFKYKKKYIVVDVLFLLYFPIHFIIFSPINRWLENQH